MPILESTFARESEATPIRKSHSILPAVVAAFLLLAVLVPALDHHLAERVSVHAHVVVAHGVAAAGTGQLATHTHGYERPHAHHSDESDAGPIHACETAVIVVLVEAAAIPATVESIPAPSWLAPSVVIPPADALLTPGRSVVLAPNAHNSEPPERPPITTS